MSRIISLILQLAGLSLVRCTAQNTPFQYHLDIRGSEVLYRLEWNVSQDQKRLTFRTCLKSDRLREVSVLGVGFGPYDEPSNLDLVMTMIPYETTPVFLKGFTDDERVIQLESAVKHDNSGFYWETPDRNRFCFGFERQALSCSRHGYSIDDQTTRLFLFHQFDTLRKLREFYSSRGPRFTAWLHRSSKLRNEFEGFWMGDKKVQFSSIPHSLTRVQLIKSPLEQELRETYKGSRNFELTVNEVEIPKEETTYWCKTDRLPQFHTKQHIIRFEPVLSESSKGFVHHMEVFLCTGPNRVAEYNGPCNSEAKPMGLRQCRQVIAAWAVGATGLSMPKEAGIAIGGTGGIQDVVLEIHYANMHQVQGIVDNSGFRFFLTSRLHTFDVGVIELGLVYSPRNSIPPGQKKFSLSGYCDNRCTDLALPAQGITVFASQLHTHGTGWKVATYHLRNGRRLADLNRDDHYSPHYQEIRLLQKPVRVYQGDSLVTKCTYDTTRLSVVTFGGISHKDEMCLNYIFYYPKTDLELCKSEVSQPELDEFLQQMLKCKSIRCKCTLNPPSKSDFPILTIEHRLTKRNVEITNSVKYSGSVESKFNAVDWMQADHAEELAHFYSNAVLEMHCNNSAGTRIPGSAIHVMPTQVSQHPIPVTTLNKLKCFLPDK
ncbi:copper type II ascorbate-dependent monooxygenase domain protein [Opisthorchis viverrini]|uniref:Copper type II ascorbate-dependent monooxygenase domain protein n=1 Tax=Opisthorchis viverrini TaxID=6198 RepID=A0A1S8WTD8_OPIVI|nr:copper type II ascorbate-dependent monooxygenase domain protein [Opisthorchis viverrini]